MNQKTILTSAGAFVLAIAAIFTVRANSRATGGLYVTTGTLHTCKTVNTAIPVDFSGTSSGGGNQASVLTVSGTSRLLWTNSTCSHIAYFTGL